ncbi:MAG: hypothetical protein AABP62_05295 [Planctomycetota bacterium]
MFGTEDDRARVRIDFEMHGKKFKEGEWVHGNVTYIGGDPIPVFEMKECTVVLDYFDRFDFCAFTLSDTLGVELGIAEDRDDEDEEGDFDGE